MLRRPTRRERIALGAVLALAVAALTLPLAVLVEADQRAAMRAAVFERVQVAVAVTRDDDRRIADRGRAEVAGSGYLRLEAEEAPGGTLEQSLLLCRVHILALEHPIGNSREAFGGPGRQDGSGGL